MRRLIGSFFLVCCLMGVAFSQDSSRFFLQSVSETDFGSDKLPLSFVSSFYRGEFIDSTTKTDALAHLSRRNVSGYYSHSSITAGLVAPEKHLGWFVHSEFNSIASVRYSSTLFQLAFFGNAYLSGDTATLHPFGIDAVSWVYAAGGIVLNTGKDHKTQWLFGLGPVATYDYISAESQRLSLFTADDGSYIDVDMAWQYQRTPSYPQFTGFGAAAMMRVSRPETGNMPAWFVSVTGPAYVFFNARSVYSSNDTAFHFTGAEISDIANIDNELQSTFDDLENDFSLKGDTASFGAWLPARIEAGFDGKYGNVKWFFTSSLATIHGYYPLLKLSLAYPNNKCLKAVLPIRYGGFAGINAGLGLMLNLPSGFYAGIYSDQLLSLLFPNEMTATGFAISIGFKK